MSVYVDKIRPTIQSRHWPFNFGCHMRADSVEELHRFARSIGVPRRYFRDTLVPHYQLPKHARFLAITAKAIELDSAAIAARIPQRSVVSV